jgi:tRNA(fMet)-specific endonuclease VapC
VTIRLLDTNIVSFVMKRHSLSARYQKHLTGYTLAIAFMTAAELYEGAFRAAWGRRRRIQLEVTLSGYLTFPADPTLCRIWGEIRTQRRSQPIDPADAWIAAAALQHGCDLVTHNPSDFQGITGLTIITECS